MTSFCPDEENLALWIEQRLPEVENQSVSKHLAACDACRRTVLLAYLSGRDGAVSLGAAGEERLLRTVQGALARPSNHRWDQQ